MSRFARALAQVGGRYFLCAALAVLAAGCGGGGSAESPAPAAQGEIARPDSAPVISGTPSKVAVAGQPYSFQPSATDANGDSLTFLIQNKPAWATFDASSGLLSGTPAVADAGTTAVIMISVSDGKTTTPLPGFAIAVSASSASGTGTARLNWSVPTNNTDGTPIADLAGYTVQYGNSPTDLAQRVDIADPAATTYTLKGLGSGTWYFALSSYTTAGVQSILSNVASKTIQ